MAAVRSSTGTQPKILFYAPGLVDGGAERLWACLATAFAERGWDVHFAQDFEADDNRSNLSVNIPVHTLGHNHLKAVWALSRLIRREKFDIAIGAVGGSNLKLLLAKLISLRSTKTVITFHGFEEYKTGLLSYLTYRGLSLWARSADLTITGSDGLRRALIERWGCPHNRAITLPNPVFYPRDIRVPSEAELVARDDIILSAGRFVPEKDFPTLIEAFALLDRPSARLVILGKGPEQHTIEAEIKRFGQEGRVSLPGYSREPWTSYQSAKCFVLSSVSEQFGNVIVEALAHGLPIVATRCAGPMEILDEGKFGQVAQPGDAHGIAAAMARCLDNPGDPAKRLERAQNYAFASRVPAYEAALLTVLKKEVLQAARQPHAVTIG